MKNKNNIKKIRLGFIGCGQHGLQHIKIAAELSESFNIAAIGDPNSSALGKAAGFAPNAYKTSAAKDLLSNNSVDAVIIAPPFQFHPEYIDAAIKAGKHIYCEKPLGFVPSGRIKAWIQKAKNRGLVFTSCHPRRAELAYIDAKKNLKEYTKNYGKLAEFDFRYFSPVTKESWKKSRNMLFYHMSHDIDLVNFILGAAKIKLDRINDSDKHYAVAGKREDGARVCFSGYLNLSRPVSIKELTLTFERGRVKIGYFHQNDKVKMVTAEENFEKNSEPEITNSYHYAHGYSLKVLMQNFADVIYGSAKNYLTDQDLHLNTAACYMLSKTGRYCN